MAYDLCQAITNKYPYNFVANLISDVVTPEGWLSNTYLSGLILPGEGLSHFLISTLLENDQAAIASLGRDACLYGGFRYQHQSFWSKECIVGRVLAAGKGATECMGWISAPVIPKGLKHSGDVWVDIEVEPYRKLMPQHPSKNLRIRGVSLLTFPGQLKKNALTYIGIAKNENPRILHSQEIERDGHVIGGADSSSVLPGDFVLPSEEPALSEPIFVSLTSLDLVLTDDSNSIIETPTSEADIDNASTIMTYSAMMRFSVDADGEDKREVNLALTHAVNFVTAYPCVTSPGALKLANLWNTLNGVNSPTGSSRDFTGMCNFP